MNAISEFLRRLFTYQYLFGPTLPSLSKSDWGIFYLGAVALVIGIILYVVNTRFKSGDLRRRLWSRWANLYFYIGLCLIIWFGLRYELIDYFSAHIVWVLILVAAIIWKIFILTYQFGNYRRQRENFEREELKKKYL